SEFIKEHYYPINVISLKIPSLKMRIEDIPIIISYKLKNLADLHQLEEKTIDEKIIREFYLYDWPGNIRELFNIVERLFVLTTGNHINYEDFLNLVDLKTTNQDESTFYKL